MDNAALRAFFGAKGQIAVGAWFVAATLAQGWWWGLHSTPTATAIFWLSIEALLFASYSIIATGLGYRATERVEAKITVSKDQ